MTRPYAPSPGELQISLLGSVALLAALGVARTHQQNFTLFLSVVLGVAVLVVVVFVATEPRGE
jgi:hypothetical protein